MSSTQRTTVAELAAYHNTVYAPEAELATTETKQHAASNGHGQEQIAALEWIVQFLGKLRAFEVGQNDQLEREYE